MLGPLLLDLIGTQLSPQERELIEHPLVGGVILFTRNYENPEQLAALTRAIREVREQPVLIVADQEGGRVQRFRDGFTRLPSPRLIGELSDRDAQAGIEMAHTVAWMMASELSAVGIDFSFSPVVDLDASASRVIGDRAFHKDVDVVTTLADAWVEGVREAGQKAVAKHYPGHGSVSADSHVDSVADARAYDVIFEHDMAPYRHLVHKNIAGILMSHVVYSQVDAQPASLSHRWMSDIVRGELGHQGAVFCDDLNMQAAAMRGDSADIAQQALQAGCDMFPLCNNRPAVEQVLDRCKADVNPHSHQRLAAMRATHWPERAALRASERWQAGERRIQRLLEQA